jgi:hypothetical protein
MFGNYEKIFSGSKYTTGTANGKDEKGGRDMRRSERKIRNAE